MGCLGVACGSNPHGVAVVSGFQSGSFPFLISSIADAVSNNERLKGIGAQLKTSHVVELSSVGLIPTKASIPLASLSHIDSIFNSHLGAILVLGP